MIGWPKESCLLPGGGIRMTPDLAYAAGRDAGERSRRKKWDPVLQRVPPAWDDEDYAIACETTNRLLLACLPPALAEQIREMEGRNAVA